MHDFINLPDAIKYAMKTMGWSRRKAENFLVEAVKEGRLQLLSHRIGPSGEDLGIEVLPPTIFEDVDNEP